MNHLKLGCQSLKVSQALPCEAPPLAYTSHRTAARGVPLAPLQAGSVLGVVARCAQHSTWPAAGRGEEAGWAPKRGKSPRIPHRRAGASNTATLRAPLTLYTQPIYDSAEKISIFPGFSRLSLQKNCHRGFCCLAVNPR